MANILMTKGQVLGHGSIDYSSTPIFKKYIYLDKRDAKSSILITGLNHNYSSMQILLFLQINWEKYIYSFGIVLLEPAIIKSYENTHIVQWVSPLLARGDIRHIVDPRPQGNFDSNFVRKALETAMAYVALISTQRPSMSHGLLN